MIIIVSLVSGYRNAFVSILMVLQVKAGETLLQTSGLICHHSKNFKPPILTFYAHLVAERT